MQKNDYSLEGSKSYFTTVVHTPNTTVAHQSRSRQVEEPNQFSSVPLLMINLTLEYQISSIQGDLSKLLEEEIRKRELNFLEMKALQSYQKASKSLQKK